MKTSLLVLSLLFTSTSAIDIKTAPPVKPDHTKVSSSHEAEKSHIKVTAPKASDHKVDSQ
jgi:hypothetical protein